MLLALGLFYCQDSSVSHALYFCARLQGSRRYSLSQFQVLGFTMLRDLCFPNHLPCCFELYSDCIALRLSAGLTFSLSCFHFYYIAALTALNGNYFTLKF